MGSAEPMPVLVSFDSPAQYQGASVVDGLERVVVLFNGTSWSAQADLHGAVEATTYHAREAKAWADPAANGNHDLPPDAPSRQDLGSVMQAELDGRPAWASLVLEAKTVEMHSSDGYGRLMGMRASECLDAFLTSTEGHHRLLRPAGSCPGTSQVALRLEGEPGQPVPVVLRASGVTRLEWHNVEVRCTTDPCPTGGERAESRVGVMPEQGFIVRDYRYVEVRAASGNVTLEGFASAVLGHSEALDASVQGRLRLPRALGGGFTTDDNGTLQTHGNSTLAGLWFPPEESRLESNFSGTFTQVLLDEQPLPVGLEPASVAVVLVGGALLLLAVKVALWLRTVPLEPLSHPRRQVIYDAVRQHPGATRAKLAAVTGMSTELLRFHLGILERGGLVVRQGSGRVAHYFENHGKYGKTWPGFEALQNANLRHLHDLLLRHPGLSKHAVVQLAAQELAWPRSTTVHRLSRLVKAHLVEPRGPRNKLGYFPRGPPAVQAETSA